MVDKRDIIIEKPESLNEVILLRDKILTLIFWFFLAYIFRPLLSLILWILFGVHIFNPDIFNIGLYDDITNFLVKNSFTIFSFAIIFISWALYNKITFGKLHRRRAIPEVKEDEIAKFFKIDLEKLKKWKKSRYIKFKIAEKDSSIKIDSI